MDANSQTVTFPHRHNPGTWDAICPHCLRTIARVATEKELRMAEQDHDCERFASSGYQVRDSLE
jgi:hypothetical protein